MTNLLLLMSITGISLLLIRSISGKRRKVDLKTSLELFAFGALLSLPFALIKNFAFGYKFYVIILAFIAIELVIVSVEQKWEYLHRLIHKNNKNLRLLSFFVIGLGFTYSELFFYILKSHESFLQLVSVLPFKALLAISTHTILTSSAAVLTATESIVEHVILFFIYYLRLVFISISHYLYAFFSENKITYLILPILIYNVYLLLKHKRYLDKKGAIID